MPEEIPVNLHGLALVSQAQKVPGKNLVDPRCPEGQANPLGHPLDEPELS